MRDMTGMPNPWAVPTVGVAEAGRLLHMSRSSAYRAAAAGDLPTVRLSGRMVVPVAGLYRLLGLPLPLPGGQVAPRVIVRR